MRQSRTPHARPIAGVGTQPRNLWPIVSLFIRVGQGSGDVIDIRLKRAYEPASSSDGYRVLIDRHWPRGISRERAKLDEWEKELSPSAELREWFGHDPERFAEFQRRHIDELRDQRPRLAALRRRGRAGTLTLVYSARDEKHNDAVVPPPSPTPGAAEEGSAFLSLDRSAIFERTWRLVARG